MFHCTVYCAIAARILLLVGAYVCAKQLLRSLQRSNLMRTCGVRVCQGRGDSPIRQPGSSFRGEGGVREGEGEGERGKDGE